ncbi:MAG: hypothetical protein OIN87_06840 [Candidatus Methanoperedens sp.]|nr:hypothetical protein [Candidatus Methanoperedens sp.]
MSIIIKVVVLVMLSLSLLSGSADADFSSTSSYRTAPGDLISHEDKLYLWEKDVEMVSRECGENRTLLKEGYLFLYDNVTHNYKESISSANFSLYKNGEIVTQSNVKEGDFFYYNKTIDGNEYTIIKFKVVNIFSADGTCGGYWAVIQSFSQYSDGTNKTETLASSPTRTLMAVPTETSAIIPPEKTFGFEAVLAISILLAVYSIRGKK